MAQAERTDDAGRAGAGSRVEVYVFADDPLVCVAGGKPQPLRGNLDAARVARALLRILVLQRPHPLTRRAVEAALQVASNAISKGIGDLRRHMGRTTIITTGDGRIGLQPFVVTDFDAVVHALEHANARVVLELTARGSCRGNDELVLALPDPADPTGGRRLGANVEEVERAIRTSVRASAARAREAISAVDAHLAADLVGWLLRHAYADTVEVEGLRMQLQDIDVFPSAIVTIDGGALRSADQMACPAPRRALPGVLRALAGDLHDRDFDVARVDPGFGFADPYAPKIGRRIDERLEALIESSLDVGRPSVIVLVGPSGSGKTRAVRDVLRVAYPQVEVLMPENAVALGAAIERGAITDAVPTTGRVLVLDDLEVFATPRGLTRVRLRRLQSAAGPLVVLATAGGKGPALLDDDERRANAAHLASLRELWDHELNVAAKLLPDELAAAPIVPEVRQRLSQEGLIWLTGARRLREKLASGRHTPTELEEPLGRRLVRTLVEWHACQLPHGMPEHALRAVVAHDEPSATETDVDRALRWALRELAEGLTLVTREHDGRQYAFAADDYIRTGDWDPFEDNASLARWRQLTVHADPQQILSILSQARPGHSPEDLGMPRLRAALQTLDVPPAVLTELDTTEAAALDSLLVTLWETAEFAGWEEREPAIERATREFLQAAERSASGGDPEGLSWYAEHHVRAGSPAHDYYRTLALRRALDGWQPPNSAGFLSLTDEMSAVMRRHLQRGRSDLVKEVGELLERLAPDPTCAESVATSRVITAYLHQSPPETITVPAAPDDRVIAAVLLDADANKQALVHAGRAWRHRTQSDADETIVARCLIANGELQTAEDLLRSDLREYETAALLADVLALQGRFAEQLATLLDLYERVAADPARGEDRWTGYPWRASLTLERREVDAVLLLEALEGRKAAERFCSHRIARRGDAAVVAAHFGWHHQTDASGPDDALGPLPLWGRQVAVGRQVGYWEDDPLAVASPWDERYARIEVPGYREVSRAIAEQLTHDGHPTAAAMLACEYCLAGNYSAAETLVIQATRAARDAPERWIGSRVFYNGYHEETPYLYRAAELLIAGGGVTGAIAALVACAADSSEEAALKIAELLQAHDAPMASDWLHQAEALRRPLESGLSSRA